MSTTNTSLRAGAIRKDVEITDVLTLASAIAHAGELTREGSDLSERLLAVAFDGLRRSPSAPSRSKK